MLAVCTAILGGAVSFAKKISGIFFFFFLKVFSVCNVGGSGGERWGAWMTYFAPSKLYISSYEYPTYWQSSQNVNNANSQISLVRRFKMAANLPFGNPILNLRGRNRPQDDDFSGQVYENRPRRQ